MVSTCPSSWASREDEHLCCRHAQGRRQGLHPDRVRLFQPLRLGPTHTSKMPVTAVQILNNHASLLRRAGREDPDHPERQRARVLRPTGQAPLRALPAARGHRASNHEGREAPVERLHRAVPPHAPRRTSPDQGTHDLVRHRRRRSRRIWMRILRPTTSAGPTAAAAWRGARPAGSSRPGSPESEP